MGNSIIRRGCGCCFFVATTALSAILFLLPSPNFPVSWRTGLLFLLCVTLLAFTTKWLFRKRLTAAEYLEQLEAQGMVQSDCYRAKRAFQINAWANEGLHYFIELEDAAVLYLPAVLYLNDDKLYAYEPIADDPELNQPRRFPNTEFCVRKHRTKGHLIDLTFTGGVFEPEIVLQIQHRDEYQSLLELKPNSVVYNRTYDQIKAERLARSKEHNQ
jgi:hypothetical protein